jgi:hypothetical protein
MTSPLADRYRPIPVTPLHPAQSATPAVRPRKEITVTMLEENTTVTTDAATEAEIAPIPGYKEWCPKCYGSGIERLIAGFTIEHYDPAFEPRIVPPLSPGAALSLRQAAAKIIAQRASWPSDAADHARHAGGR